METIVGKTVYVLGAGASQHTGAPLLRDFLVAASLLLESNPRLKHRDSFKNVFEWISRLRGSSYYVEFDLDNLEHVFSLSEMLRQVGDKDGEVLTAHLKHVIMETLDRKCKLEWKNNRFQPDYLYSLFVKNLEEINDARKRTLGKAEGDFERDTIITFNYDVMLDYAMYFHNMAPEYCLFPPPYLNSRYRLLKLHGSINWGLCRGCTKQSDTTVQAIPPTPLPRDRMVAPFVEEGTLFEMLMMTEVLPEFSCGFCKAQKTLEPVAIPPTWSKAVDRTPLSLVWSAAVRELQSAFQIIVIGYSMPQTDTFFQYLLTLSLSQNSRLNRVVVVNNDRSDSLRERYQRVFSRSLSDRGRLQFVDITFDQFAHGSMKQFGAAV